MALATVLVFVFTPPTRIFVENITSRALWSDLHQRLLPQDNKWFYGLAWMAEPAPTGTVPALDLTVKGEVSLKLGQTRILYADTSWANCQTRQQSDYISARSGADRNSAH
jgi:hypothetical protein